MGNVVLGFTGTQKGMNNSQKRRFRVIVQTFKPTEFRHGDCIGADKDAHDIVRIVAPDCKIVIHPPTIDAKRAYCKGDTILPAKPYLNRNRDIVKASNIMVATPGEDTEQLRSGTWATIRAARSAKRRTTILLPSD